MTHARIAAERLANQRLARPAPRDPAAVVSWFGAIQAQDFGAATWAIALRLRRELDAPQVVRAIDEGRILRTHLMRPTWHFVAADDIRWLLDLTAPRVHRALAWGHTQLGTDAALRHRAMTVIERALTSEAALTRPELAAQLARAGMPLAGTALALVVMHAELEGLICSGPRRGKQSTYALLERRVPRAPRLSRDEALAELTRRYLRSHGPATVRDFAWWSGVAVADARRGVDIVRARPMHVDGLTYWSTTRPRAIAPSRGVHLLPVYDEYLVAYRDLDAVPRGDARWGILPQAFIARGQVAGVWKAERRRDRIVVRAAAERRVTRDEQRALARAAERYGRFHGVHASLRFL
ncbi:MAG TPA: winged helix DNA-binding domain-containing protein [Vicinamibacterales bacterium]|nr:winged helix DNA-binding domain-containing protein [Vicinamibacterales bacterium]